MRRVGRWRQKCALVRARLGHEMLKAALTRDIFPCQSGFSLVGVTGFEPATSWSQTTRSTKLSYTPLAAHMFIMSRRNTHAKVYDLTAALPISASIAPDEPTILKRKIFP